MLALKNLNLKIFLLFALIWPCIGYAQVWQMLGMREQDQTSFNYTHIHNMVLSPSGVPYIIFQDDQTEQKGLVKRFVNGKWEIVGSGYIAEDYSTDMALSFSPDGSLYAVYQCVIEGPGSRINVKKLINDKWVNVSKAGINADLHPSLTFAENGIPYLAFSSSIFNSGGVQVRKFENGRWVPVGTTDHNPISVKAATYNKLINYKNEFYLAYSDDDKDKKITVKKLINNVWTSVGIEGFSDGQASFIDMSFSNNGTLHVIYQDGGHSNKVTVKKFENGAWLNLGNPGLSFGASKSSNIIFTKNNTPVIFYTDESLTNKAIFGKFTNGEWSLSELTPNTSASINLNTRMKIDANDNIYVSYVDQALNYGTAVKKLVIDKWEGVGINGVSPEGTTEVSIKIDQSGVPYVAYIDVNDQYKASVKKYSNGSWQLVGSSSFTTHNTKYINLAISPNNIPYLIYRDNGGNVNVMKFNGTNWEKVGPTITMYQSYNLKIAIAPNGTPYIAYSDAAFGNKLIVRKFDGYEWVAVGNYVTTLGAGDVALSISKNGIIYVGYTDITNFYKNVTVKKFIGSTWQTIGLGSFTNSTNVSGVGLAIADDETPYVSYCDGENSLRAKVKKYSSEAWVDVGDYLSAGNSRTTSIILSKNGDPIIAYQDSKLGFKTAVSTFKNGSWVLLGGSTISRAETLSAELAIDQNGEVYVAYASPQAMVGRLVSDSDLAPVIYDFAPRAFEGNKVSIIGDNFNGTTEVKFGSAIATSFTVVSSKEIIAEVGNGASGLVYVKTPNGEASKGDFIFVTHPPVITAINPISNKIGETVQILGNYFSTNKDDNIVYFGPVKATVVSATATSLQVNVPAYSAYNIVSVTVNNSIAYSPIPFMVKPTKITTTIDATTFENKKDFATEKRPQMIRLGDIDGDGKTDVILTHDGIDAFSVFLNQSTPTNISFANSVQVASGFSPNALIIVDVDGDGKLDVFMAGSGVSFYRNTSTKGNVSFAAPFNYGKYSYPFSTASTDLDLDGRSDFVATAINAPWGVHVMRNVALADAYLYVENQITLSTSSISNSIITGDLNNDGYPELISNAMDGIYIYNNLSSPGKLLFNLLPNGLRVADYAASEPIIADLDGDGKADIVTANNTVNQIAVYKNQSTAAIAFADRKMFATQNSPEFLAVADFNGDGLPDLAVVNFGSNTVSVLKNTSTLGNILMAEAVNFPVGQNPSYLTAGDIDGDGFTDLVVSNASENTFSVLKNGNGKITFPTSNFNIAIKSTTCTGSNNGSIAIVGNLNLNYVAEVTIGSVKTDYNFAKEINIENLKPGTYAVNLYVKDQPSDIRSYTVVVTEPKALSVYSSVDMGNGVLNLKLDGSNLYHINLNEKEYITTQSVISLPLNFGNNSLRVNTDIACQGIFTDLIKYNNQVKVYPNPVDRILSIRLDKPMAKLVKITVYNPVGEFVFKQHYSSISNEIGVDLSQLSSGIYVVKLDIDGIITQHKVIKK